MIRPFRKTRSQRFKTRCLELETFEARLMLSSSPLPPLASTDPLCSQPKPDANDIVVMGNGSGGSGSGSGGPTFGPNSIPQLSSLPGAKCSIYLNFAGDFTAQWGSYSNITTPAYDIDGDPSTFTQTELNNITKIWQFVSEDYAPFNINVTTVQPANLGYGYTQKVDIGGNGAWTGGNYGGISYIGSFTGSGPNISFVFPNNMSATPAPTKRGIHSALFTRAFTIPTAIRSPSITPARAMGPPRSWGIATTLRSAGGGMELRPTAPTSTRTTWRSSPTPRTASATAPITPAIPLAMHSS
jgi:hypothetical protein